MRKLAMLMLSLLCIITGIWAQTVTVTGKVTNAKGVTIPGASVKAKGSKTGVSADNFGVFRFTVTPGTILIVSATGSRNKRLLPPPI